jgi:1-acyl-sn-glycerol-3-phosphate acyltransferase
MSQEKARKRWFLALARRYVRRRLSAQFDGMFIEGLPATRALAEHETLIVAATHVAWWDALVAVQLDALLDAHSYCLMDAKNLVHYPFFAWLGAIPLDSVSRKQALTDMRRAASLLSHPGRVLWIFPQGKQRAAHLRPLALQSGVRWLSQKSGARVVPLALSYTFREAAQPSILASFGTPIAAGTANLMAVLEEQMIACLARIDQFVADGVGEFVPVLPRRPEAQGAPRAARLLAWLAGGAAAKGRMGDGARPT